MDIRDAHFPRRASLDAYGNGGFRFAEMSHQGSILCVPSGIYGWAPRCPADLAPETFERVLAEADDIEVFLLGTGDDMLPMSDDLKQMFRDQGIISESMSTGAAVRTFNVMLAEERAVAGAFLAVENSERIHQRRR